MKPELFAARLEKNPFFVLGLTPDASRQDVEREGQKLLSMLELNLEAARTYLTPLGPRPRTSEDVRQAIVELRDPRRRLLHEVFAISGAEVGSSAPASEPALSGSAPWPEATRVFGFGPARRTGAPD